MTYRFLTLALMTLPLLIASATAQPPDTTLTRSWNRGNNEENIYCARPTDDGGLILTGSVDADTYGDIWVAKTNSNCDIEWEHLIGGNLTDSGDYIEQTSDGGYIVCGETWSWSGDTSFGMFVAKLDSEGTLIWTIVRSDPGYNDAAVCVREIQDGDFIVTGEYTGVPFLWRIGPNGEERWLTTYIIEDTEEWIWYVTPTSDDGFVIAGQLIDDSGHNMALIKANSSGDLLWVNRYPDIYAEYFSYAYCVEESRDGGLLVCGYFSDYQPNYTDWILLKTDSDGEQLWETRISDIYTQGARQLVETTDGGIVVCGRSDTAEYVRSHIAKTDSLGNLLWQNTLDLSESWTVCQMRDGSFAAAGPKNETGVGPSESLYLIKWEPEIAILLSPDVTIIPLQGTTLHYQAYVNNILLDPTPLDVWANVITPAGNTYPLQQITVTLQPGGTFYRPSVPLDIPAAAPPGEYTFELHIGVAPPDDPPGGPTGSRNMGLGSFTFTKVDGR